MDDLISKQALIEDIQKSMEDNPHIDDKIKLNHHTEHFHFLTLVNKQPIAYDVDRVVEQLRHLPHGAVLNVEFEDDIISIVKGGGQGE